MELADANQVTQLVDRLASELEAAMDSSEGPWALIGVRRRGDELAKILNQRLKVDYSGSVDIALYRDDLSEIGPQPVVRTSEIDFPIDGTNVVLVDDVLMTGRSVRAAIQSLIDFGRPRCIRLLVLVDRGGRELPIAPDFVGLRVNADRDRLIEVRLKPSDAEDRISMVPLEKATPEAGP